MHCMRVLQTNNRNVVICQICLGLCAVYAVDTSHCYVNFLFDLLDVQMFQDESWEPTYFGVKRSRLRVTKTLLPWVFALL